MTKLLVKETPNDQQDRGSRCEVAADRQVRSLVSTHQDLEYGAPDLTDKHSVRDRLFQGFHFWSISPHQEDRTGPGLFAGTETEARSCLVKRSPVNAVKNRRTELQRSSNSNTVADPVKTAKFRCCW